MKSPVLRNMVLLSLGLAVLSMGGVVLYLLLVQAPLQAELNITVRAPSTTRFYSLEGELPSGVKSSLKGIREGILLIPRSDQPLWRLPVRVDRVQPLPHVLRLYLTPLEQDDAARLYLQDHAEGTIHTRLILGRESLWVKLTRRAALPSK